MNAFRLPDLNSIEVFKYSLMKQQCALLVANSLFKYVRIKHSTRGQV